MRVTQQMLHQNSVRNMGQNLSRFEKTNSQVASGKMLERPSDNPNGVSQAMSLKSSLAANGQYEKNIDTANLLLDETDQTIGKMTDVMQRVRELAVNGNNGTLAPEDRATIAAEIKELANQLEEFSKAKVNGQDLFAAAKGGEREFTISNGITIKATTSKEALFGTGDQLIQSVKDWADSISKGEEVKLDEIDATFNGLLSVQSEVGARANRVEAFENRLLDNNLQLQKMLSSIEDVDYAEAMIRLKSEESVYQASLASSAKIIQPTLMDFLR
ncbi:flagellar hook-associated protein FlgL [Planococcus sp. NCCP-2050]|uniref:flagellar hook-associated protein FlgL n=1 Tax=Planococcus sp. NCCP-2050 TaxID=2944679 RepID=UPI00203E5B4B|nr:flagellar hook-associated protein FlgL [Planococcus sp. NCCP-2050]GKW46561.1 hypothetical protein NCCP2050_22530 [Planococcus sp. NCCP-2050]